MFWKQTIIRKQPTKSSYYVLFYKMFYEVFQKLQNQKKKFKLASLCSHTIVIGLLDLQNTHRVDLFHFSAVTERAYQTPQVSATI